MQQFQGLDQNRFQGPECSCLGGVFLGPESRFYHLDVPVAELLPDEIVNLLEGDSQLVLIHVLGNIFCQRVDLGEDPAVSHLQVRKLHIRYRRFLNVHHDETGCIPYLVRKVTACFHTLPIEAHIVARCVTGHQCHTKCIGAVLVDNLERIDTISKGFTHLASLGVAYQTVDQDGVERLFARLLQTREYHTDNPEENDIVSGYQHVGRIEIFIFRCILRPAERGERPQGGGEPGIQRVLILMQVGAAAFRAYRRCTLGNGHLAAVITIISRNPVSPPELTGNAPVTDALKPVQIGLSEALRNEFKSAGFKCLYRRFRHLFHLDKPLRFYHRLYGCAAAVVGTYVVGMRNDFD